MLHDQLVCGINDSKLQRRLLSESTLTIQKAFKLAQALEFVETKTKSQPTHVVEVRDNDWTFRRPAHQAYLIGEDDDKKIVPSPTQVS